MYKVYEVSFGDTLDSIAKKFNTTVYELKNINNITSLTAGQLIVVPNYNDNEYFDVYVIKKGDTLYSIALNNNVTVSDLANINGINQDDYIYPGQEILVPKNDIKMIVTDKEDTLESISKKMGIKQDELITQNEILYVLPDQLVVYRK